MKAKRTDLESDLAATRSENTLLAIALQCVVNGEADATERCRADDARYVLRLFRPTACHGGIVAVTWQPTNAKQAPSTTVHYLDDYKRMISSSPGVSLWSVSDAVDRLVAARQSALDSVITCAACGRPERKTRPFSPHPITGEHVCKLHRGVEPCATCKTVAHTSGHCLSPTSNFWRK